MPIKETMTSPCNECPFLNKFKNGFSYFRLVEFALIPDFHCHQTGDIEEADDYEDDARHPGGFVPNEKSVACAGAKIFLAKRKKQFNYPFDDSKLDMAADVR